ncbi:hypothetical protein EYF80_068191 [Liparis tanakae]|uniref:Uncharacterized protein n=1 Tax=Liparis tanakae TaxID=230148 RepID=A0A4Z2DZ37_9TELE|nr:hypothetical protein EYF80_068191 [Liparis tanakae]
MSRTWSSRPQGEEGRGLQASRGGGGGASMGPPQHGQVGEEGRGLKGTPAARTGGGGGGGASRGPPQHGQVGEEGAGPPAGPPLIVLSVSVVFKDRWFQSLSTRGAAFRVRCLH